MQFTEKIIDKKNIDYKKIKSFMRQVFPRVQLYPMWGTVLISKIKKHQFTAYYHNDNFIGIFYNIILDDSVYLFYFAVNDELHSKGYGTQMLQHLFAKYKGKYVTTLIDTMNPCALDYEIRKRRLNFYEKNGFVYTDIKAGIFKPTGDFISTDKNLTVDKCKKIFKKIPCKIYPPKEKK